MALIGCLACGGRGFGDRRRLVQVRAALRCGYELVLSLALAALGAIDVATA